MADLVLTQLLGFSLFLIINVSFVIELLILVAIGRRYSERRTELLKYLLISSAAYFVMIFVMIGLLCLLIFNLQAVWGPNLFHFMNELLYKLINIIGMIILAYNTVFIFNLFPITKRYALLRSVIPETKGRSCGLVIYNN